MAFQWESMASVSAACFLDALRLSSSPVPTILDKGSENAQSGSLGREIRKAIAPSINILRTGATLDTLKTTSTTSGNFQIWQRTSRTKHSPQPSKVPDHFSG